MAGRIVTGDVEAKMYSETTMAMSTMRNPARVTVIGEEGIDDSAKGDEVEEAKASTDALVSRLDSSFPWTM